MGRRIDLTGKQFGRLVALEYVGNNAYKNALWKCACSCGAVKVISGDSLRRGLTTSCGCLHKEVAAKVGAERLTKHGLHNTPTYYSWQNMLTRATNPNYKQARDYSERGITVCEEWKDFSNFVADMGVKPEGMTLDRIDNDKGYEPGNCRWATPLEQATNKRTTISWEGKTVVEWAKELGVNYYTVQRRLKKFGSVFPEGIRETVSTPDALRRKT